MTEAEGIYGSEWQSDEDFKKSLVTLGNADGDLITYRKRPNGEIDPYSVTYGFRAHSAKRSFPIDESLIREIAHNAAYREEQAFIVKVEELSKSCAPQRP